MKRWKVIATASTLLSTVLITVPLVTTAGAVVNADAHVNGCDILVTAPVGHDCLLPWPNDAFTVASSSSATGRQLAIPATLDPVNKNGVHVNTKWINHNDGFSPGSLIMTFVPNIGFSNSQIAPSTNIGMSLLPNAPVVVLDTKTGFRVPYFGEIDAQATDASNQMLLIHPAIALTEGHRYAVVFRNLVDSSGLAIASPPPARPASLPAGTVGVQ